MNDDMTALIAALHDQSAALRDLAESNRAVVDLVIAQQGEDEDNEGAGTYLDGSPLEG